MGGVYYKWYFLRQNCGIFVKIGVSAHINQYTAKVSICQAHNEKNTTFLHKFQGYTLNVSHFLHIKYIRYVFINKHLRMYAE